MGLRILSKTHLKRLYTEFERSSIDMSINGMSLQNINRFYLSFINKQKNTLYLSDRFNKILQG